MTLTDNALNAKVGTAAKAFSGGDHLILRHAAFASLAQVPSIAVSLP